MPSSRRRLARPTPTATGRVSEVADHREVVARPFGEVDVAVPAAGRARLLPKWCSSTVSAVVPLARWAARSRCIRHMTSSGRAARATPGRDRLLARPVSRRAGDAALRYSASSRSSRTRESTIRRCISSARPRRPVAAHTARHFATAASIRSRTARRHLQRPAQGAGESGAVTRSMARPGENARRSAGPRPRPRCRS